MRRTWRILILVLLFDPILSSAQQNCGNVSIEPSQIFGANSLELYGQDTIITPEDNVVIYSCRSCNIIAFNNRENKLWTIDLSEEGCKIILFQFIPKESINLKGMRARKPEGFRREIGKAIIKGYEIIVQTADGDLYGITPKDGRKKLIVDKEEIR